MKKALVTAGPTHEAIDPVRFIGNHSSGKMGFALSEVLRDKGYEVTLVAGPVHLATPEGVNRVNVRSAYEMYSVCEKHYREMDLAIFAAAVADYTPKIVSDIKIKKSEDEFSIQLVRTKDIAKEMGLLKTKNQVNVGFALETNDSKINAIKKLESKNFDFVVLNTLSKDNACFGVDKNKITILEHNKSIDFEFKTKHEIAKDIVSHIQDEFN